LLPQTQYAVPGVAMKYEIVYNTFGLVPFSGKQEYALQAEV